MTNKEFNLEFDVLYDNVTSGKAPGLNKYEKSVFLTKAQDQILKNYFNPKGNKYQEGHSDSPKRTVDFSSVIKSAKISGTVENTTYRNTMVFNRPNDILIPRTFILRNDSGKELQVIPVSEEELTRLFSKPYKEPYKGEAYKLEDSTTNNVYQIIVGRANIQDNFDLYIRYVKVPKPILLVPLKEFELEWGLKENSLSLNGTRLESTCELDPALHNEILDRAVNLAKVYYEGNPEGIVQYSTLNE